MTFATVQVIYFLRKQARTVSYLLDLDTNKNDIEGMIKLKNKLECGEEHDENGKHLDVASVGKGLKRMQAAKELHDRAVEINTLKMLKKKVRVNYVDSDQFYQLNRKFFMPTLMFQLFEAMAFNSCSDIPALFMILLLFAFYAYRKQYSVAYREYSFFVIYFIQINLTLKVIFSSLIRIDFIREAMESESNQNKPGVKFLNLWFGGVTQKDANSELTPVQIKENDDIQANKWK